MLFSPQGTRGKGLSLVRYPVGSLEVRGRQSATCSYHSYCIIEQRLAEDDDKERLINVYLLKDS